MLTPEQPRLAGGAAAKGRIVVDDLVEICHGSPFDEDAYIFDELDAVRALKASTRPLCLFGHTHYPVDVRAVATDAIRQRRAGARRRRSCSLDGDGSKYLVNPGSVGQPRDGDPRAAYAIVDTSSAASNCFACDYPVEETQAQDRSRRGCRKCWRSGWRSAIS